MRAGGAGPVGLASLASKVANMAEREEEPSGWVDIVTGVAYRIAPWPRLQLGQRRASKAMEQALENGPAARAHRL